MKPELTNSTATLVLPFNRTIEELKRVDVIGAEVAHYPFNRTIEELKPNVAETDAIRKMLLIAP